MSDAQPTVQATGSALSGGDLRAGFGWPKVFRVRRRVEYTAVQRDGRKVQASAFAVLVRPNGLSHPRFGMAVSRKVGPAVARNGVKRRLREAFRHLRAEVGSFDCVVLARPALVGQSTAAVRDALEAALRRSGAMGQAVRGADRRGGRS